MAELRDDRLEVTFTYLEMHERPKRPRARAPMMHSPMQMMRAHKPTIGFYRYLYNAVGEPWLWYERRVMDDAKLRTILDDELIEIYVLYFGGVPAGYAELNRRTPPDIELNYFGLVPDFIGRGLGGYFLDAVTDIAWDHEPARLWLHTCTLDHPRALPNYQKAGFVPYGQKTRLIPDPRKLGYLPPDAGPVKL